MESVDFGFYAVLNCTFGSTADELKKAFRKASLKLHPDRNPGDEEAKNKFQKVNSAFACLSDAVKRAEYDSIFRMRCVLEQGALTTETLHSEDGLDAVYLFAVQQPKGLGLREDQVLMVSLEDGIAKGIVERRRGGEVVDSRDLSHLRTVEADTASLTGLRLQYRDDNGRASTTSLLARSPSERSTIMLLLRTLTAASAADTLRPRRDDRSMPPAPRLAAWLTLRSGGTFAWTSKVFAMLGRSKLLIFTDGLCTNLKQLITLETGALQVHHTAGDTHLELAIHSTTPPEKAAAKAAKASFKMTLVADTPFVATQWAQSITEGLLQQGLNEPVGASSAGTHSTTGAPVAEAAAGAMAGDPFEPSAPPPRARWSRKGPGAVAGLGEGSGATSLPEVGDLLGDLSTPPRGGGGSPHRSVPSDLQELYSTHVEIDTALGEAVCEDRTAADDGEGLPGGQGQPAGMGAVAAETGAGGGTSGGPLGSGGGLAAAMSAPRGHVRNNSETSTRGVAADPFINLTDPPADLLGSASELPLPTAPPVASVHAPSLLDRPSLLDEPVANLLGSVDAGILGAASMSAGAATNTLGELADLLGGTPSIGHSVTADLEADGGMPRPRELTFIKPLRESRLGLDIDLLAPGVVVVCAVEPGSLADRCGLVVGEQLLTVGGLPVNTVDSAAEWLSSAVGAISLTLKPASFRRRPSATDIAAFDPISLGLQMGEAAAGVPVAAPAPNAAAALAEAQARQAHAEAAARQAAAPAPVPVEAPPSPSIPFVESHTAGLVVEWQLPVWAGDAAVSHYEVQWKREGELSWMGSAAARGLSQSRVRLRGLKPSSAYWVRVRSVRTVLDGATGKLASGSSTPPSVALRSGFSTSILPALTSPAPPQAFPAADGMMAIFFEPLPPFATEYDLQWRAVGDESAVWRKSHAAVTSDSSNGSSAVERDLACGGLYRFRVRVVSDDGLASAYSEPSLDVRTSAAPILDSQASPSRSRRPSAPDCNVDATGTPFSGGSVTGGNRGGQGASLGSYGAPTQAPGPKGYAGGAQATSWLTQLVELGLTEQEAATALRESGSSSLSAAADWHFTAGRGQQQAFALPAAAAAMPPPPPTSLLD